MLNGNFYSDILTIIIVGIILSAVLVATSAWGNLGFDQYLN